MQAECHDMPCILSFKNFSFCFFIFKTQRSSVKCEEPQPRKKEIHLHFFVQNKRQHLSFPSSLTLLLHLLKLSVAATAALMSNAYYASLLTTRQSPPRVLVFLVIFYQLKVPSRCCRAYYVV